MLSEESIAKDVGSWVPRSYTQVTDRLSVTKCRSAAIIVDDGQQ